MGIKQLLTEIEFYNSKRNSKIQWYPLQLQILTKMNHNKRIFVFDEVGAGKTIEAGLAIWKICLEQENAKILIITQGILIEQYKREMHDKFGIDFQNVNDTDNWGSSDPTSLFNNKPCKFIITNPSAGNIAKCRMDVGWDLVIIDEAHNFMNDGSLRTRNIREIEAKQVIMFTATPIRNRLEELQSLINLSQEITGDATKISLPIAQDFLEQYNETSCWMRNFKAVIKNDYRKRKVDIWKYNYSNDTVGKIKNNDYWNLGNIFLLWGADKSGLEQNPMGYLKEKYKLGSIDEILGVDRKADILIEKIIKIKNEKLKAIIFCRRKATIKYLEYICTGKGFNTEILLGEQQESERDEAIKQAKKGDTDIFIIMDKIGEAGLNLPEYNYVINYELPFSPADLEQRLGRIDRLVGTGANCDKPIHSIYMIHEDDEKGEIYYDNKLFYMNMYKFLPTIITQIPSRNVLFDPDMILECIDKMQFEKQWQLQIMEETKKVLITIEDIKGFKKDIIYTNQEELYTLAAQWEVPYKVILALWFEKDYIVEKKNDWADINEIIEFKKVQIDRELKEIEQNMKLAQANKEKLRDIGNGIFYYEDNMLQVKQLKGEGFIEGVYSEIAKGVIYPIVESFNTVEESSKRKDMFQDRLSEMSENIKNLHDDFKNLHVKESKAIMDKILENKYMQVDLLELYKDEILNRTNICEKKLNMLIKTIEEYSNYKLLGRKADKKKINCLCKVNYSEKQVELIISQENQRDYYLYGKDECIFIPKTEKNEWYKIMVVEYWLSEKIEASGLGELYKRNEGEIMHSRLGDCLLFYKQEKDVVIPISKENIMLDKFKISYEYEEKEIYLIAINRFRDSKDYKFSQRWCRKTIDEIVLEYQQPGGCGAHYTGWKPVETLLNYVIDVTQDYNEEELSDYLMHNKMKKVKFYSDGNTCYSTIKIMKLIYIKKIIRGIDIEKFEHLDEKSKRIKKSVRIGQYKTIDIVQQFEAILKKTLGELTPVQQNEIIKLCNEGSYNWERCRVVDKLEEDLIKKRFLWGGASVNTYDKKIEFRLNDISRFNNKPGMFICIENMEIPFQAIRVGSCLISDRKKLSENLYAKDAKALLGKEEFFRGSYKEIIKHEVNKHGEDILIYIIDKKEAILFTSKEIKEYACDDIQGEFLGKLGNISDDSWYDDMYYGIEPLEQWVFGCGVEYKDRRRYSSSKGVFLLEYICRLEESFKTQS